MFLILVPVALFHPHQGRPHDEAGDDDAAAGADVRASTKSCKTSSSASRWSRPSRAKPTSAPGRFREVTKDYCHKAIMVVNLDALADPVIELLGVVAVALALLIGAYLVLDRSAEERFLGMRMLQPSAGAGRIAVAICPAPGGHRRSRCASCPACIRACSRGFAASDRIFDFLDRRPHVRPNSDGRPAGGDVRQSIEFRDICFSYDPDNPILTNVHLYVRARRDDRSGRQERLRQNDAGRPAATASFCDPDHRGRPHRRRGRPQDERAQPAASRSASSLRRPSSSTTPSSTTSPTACDMRRRSRSKRRHAWPMPMSSSWNCPRATRHALARRAACSGGQMQPHRPGTGDSARSENPHPRRVHQPRLPTPRAKPTFIGRRARVPNAIGPCS